MYEHDKTEYAYKNGYEAGVKEFAERLKKISIEKGSVPIVFDDIDNLVKEMER